MQMSNGNNLLQWLSFSRLLQYLCKKLFTVPGGLFAIIAIAALEYHAYPPRNVFEYFSLAFPLLLWTLPLTVLPVVIPVVVGEVVANALLPLLVAKPNPARWAHQALFTLLSLPGLLFAIAVVDAIFNPANWNGG